MAGDVVITGTASADAARVGNPLDRGDAVDVWSGEIATAVAGEVGVSEIVGHDVDDIRFVLLPKGVFLGEQSGSGKAGSGHDCFASG